MTLPPLPDPRALPVISSGIPGHATGYTADQMRAYGEACAAVERERMMKLWLHYAYAALGAQRDKMTPEDVATVQRFLGPIDAIRGMKP